MFFKTDEWINAYAVFGNPNDPNEVTSYNIPDYKMNRLKVTQEDIENETALLLQIEDLIEVLEMVEDNRKMPHQHKDYYLRLCCLSERAKEVLEKYK